MNGDQTQFVISYELLCLLQWLVEHDYEKIKKIIGRALVVGLKDDLNKLNHRTANLSEADAIEIQQSILDFFSLLEVALAEAINDHAVQRAVEKKLLPAIEQIDTTICDDATVRSSVESTTAKIEHSTSAHAQQVLFRELLRRWKPCKKSIMN